MFHAMSWSCGMMRTKVAGWVGGWFHPALMVGYGQHRWLALGILCTMVLLAAQLA